MTTVGSVVAVGDVGDAYREAREGTKQHRAAMLAKANTAGWTRHTEWHFSRVFGTKRMDWWPSGGKAMLDGRMIYGHRKVNAKIAELEAGQAMTDTKAEESPQNTSGPTGTYGCACVSHDARNCSLLRYGVNSDPDCERCECLCHEWSDNDD